MQVSTGPHFVAEMKALHTAVKQRAIQALKEIEQDPWSVKPNRAELPPMWRPGTFQEWFVGFSITYCQDGSLTALKFLHVRTTATNAGFTDAM